MDRGIEAARAAGSGIHADVIETMKGQLLIVLIKRLADHTGKLDIPVDEIDDTSQDILSFSIQNAGPEAKGGAYFSFQLEKKQ